RTAPATTLPPASWDPAPPMWDPASAGFVEPACDPASAGFNSIRIDGRVRRALGSVDRQTRQSQPIIGTPCDVPVPRSVILRLNNTLPAAGRLDVAQTQLVEHLLEHLPLLRGQIAARLLLEKREDVDHLLRR